MTHSAPNSAQNPIRINLDQERNAAERTRGAIWGVRQRQEQRREIRAVIRERSGHSR